MKLHLAKNLIKYLLESLHVVAEASEQPDQSLLSLFSLLPSSHPPSINISSYPQHLLIVVYAKRSLDHRRRGDAGEIIVGRCPRRRRLPPAPRLSCPSRRRRRCPPPPRHC